MEIALGKTKAVTLIDDDDAKWVARHRWKLTTSGYAARNVCVNGIWREVRLARAVLGLEHGDPRQVDHINRNRLDNRRENLRAVTPRQNQQNQSSRGGSSRFRNVSWCKRNHKWHASVWHDGRRHHIGYFEDERRAASAAQEWRDTHLSHAEPDPALA